MRHIASRTIAAAVATAVALSALPAIPAQAASPKPAQPGISQSSATTTDFSARRRHYRSHRGGNPAAAIAAFGLIAGAIAASQQPRYGYYDYGPPPGYYGYGYGYAPRPYYRSYRYW